MFILLDLTRVKSRMARSSCRQARPSKRFMRSMAGRARRRASDSIRWLGRIELLTRPGGLARLHFDQALPRPDLTTGLVIAELLLDGGDAGRAHARQHDLVLGNDQRLPAQQRIRIVPANPVGKARNSFANRQIPQLDRGESMPHSVAAGD